MTTEPKRLPVTLLTGFLGAGKTTVLNRVLKDPALKGAAVLINEFGDIGLDHLLVEAVDDTVLVLSSGCLCCTIRGELIDTVGDLLDRREAGGVPAFDRIIIETTGLADPAPILQTLTAHPRLAGALVLDGVVTLVDAVNGLSTLDHHRESLRQVAVADRLIVTKTDLAGPSEALRARLARLNPAAPVIDGAMADAALFAGLGPWRADGKIGDVRAWLAAERHDAAHHQHSDHHHHDHDHPHHDHHHHHGHPGGQHAHDRNRHDDRIRSFSLSQTRALTPSALEMFLDLVRAEHGPKLLRYKGLVKLTDDPARPVVLHGVQHVMHPPVRLAAWPDGDATSRLVFIVQDVESARIERLFAAFSGEVRIDAPDAAALTDNPLALR
ncbi:MAG: CobW family GTP-binding protein [Labrys sp. (in: a-proteobacteria)]